MTPPSGKAAPKPSSTRPVSPQTPRGFTKAPPGATDGADKAQVQQAIVRKVEGTARKGIVKVPNFPPPSGPRPPALQMEEARRIRIVQAEHQRRQQLLQGARTPQERNALLEEWEREDALYYTNDPDDVEVAVYGVNEPWAYVQIIRNKRTHELIYHVVEPMLTQQESHLLKFIESTLVDVIDIQPGELRGLDMNNYIRDTFDSVVEDYSIVLGRNPQEMKDMRQRLLYYVLRDFTGEGPIDVLMRDTMIEDISCDGPHVPLFVYHRQYESLTTTVRFRDHNHLDSFAIRLAQRAGKHISIAEPILDATMRDGSRLQSTLAKEVSTFGSTFTIRKFREVPFTPVDLVRFGTMSPHMLAFLWLVIQYHMSAIYAGGTASGKTTALNALMLFIPPQNKVVTIEDTREIRIPQPNWIAGITRSGFGPRDQMGRQAGEIDMFQLLKNALRQRPEYIIVGEVRGQEAYSLFQAMATGHAAYGTMHADSVDAVIHRLESDPINIPRSLLEALDIVAVQAQTRIGGKRVRRTRQITEIVGLDPNTREILTNEVFRWLPSTDTFEYSGVSYALERIAAEAGLGSQEVIQELQDRVRVIQYMVKNDVRAYDKVASVITTYYKDKASAMRYVEADRPWP